VVGDRSGEEEETGWFDALLPAVYPPRESRRKPARAPGCPPFGNDSVLDRGPKARTGPAASVAPGRHRPRAGSHAVTWWDPRALELAVEETVDRSQLKVLETDASGKRAGESEEAHARWQAARREALAGGREPRMRVRPVTEVAEAVAAGREEIELGETRVETIEVGADRTGRPHGVRFGTLVHALLAAADPSAGVDAIRVQAAVQGRLVGAVEDEVEAAAEAAAAAFRHPVLRRAAASGSLRRETPVLLAVADRSLVEGVVDLAFREEGKGWTVVDFKTDVELAGRREAYETQVRIYARAVSLATGEPASGILLVV